MQSRIIKDVCYIGCRVSSQKQAQQGDSLEEQEIACRFHAQKLGCIVEKVYSEQHTATKAGDSFVDDIIQDIRKQTVRPRFFIIKSIDRFCRAGTTEYSRLKEGIEELGVQLVDTTGVIQPKVNEFERLGLEYKWSLFSPSEGSEIMEAHNSKRDASKILVRMIGEEINLVRQGYKVRQAEDGYKNEKVFIENKKRVIQIPDPQRADYLVTIFEMRASGAYTDQEIVDCVNAMGYKSKTQKKWLKDGKTKKKLKVIGHRGGIKLTIKQLQKIVPRTIYCGINTEKWLLGKAIKTQYDGLVSIDTFNKANKGKLFIEEKGGNIIIHKDYNPHQLKRMKNNPLFPHKAVSLCPICEKPFLGSSPKGKSKSIPTYHCARGHKYFGVNKVEFDKRLTGLVEKLEHKDGGFLKNLKAILINKYREKEKELGEFSIKVGINAVELEIQKKHKIEAYISTTNEVIRVELEKQINELHQQIEEVRGQRNNIEIKENDVHAFVGYVKYLMEHPVEMLVKQKNLDSLKALFGLVFEELPTYTEIVNGTPKLSIPFKLLQEFEETKSLSVTLPGIEPGLPA